MQYLSGFVFQIILCVEVEFNVATAFGTLVRRIYRLRVWWSLFQRNADDLRDDLARLLDDNGVADADVFAADFAEVVECGVLDGGAGDEDRLHVGPRRELAGLADLPIDCEQPGRGLFGGVFVGDAPAWEAAGVPESFLQFVAIDADDHAVDAIRKFGPKYFKVLDYAPDGVD